MGTDSSSFCSHLPPADVTNPLRVEDDWLTETVVALSRGIATENALDRLPILADALEEAGCNNLGMLYHLRCCEQPPRRVLGLKAGAADNIVAAGWNRDGRIIRNFNAIGQNGQGSILPKYPDNEQLRNSYMTLRVVID